MFIGKLIELEFVAVSAAFTVSSANAMFCTKKKHTIKLRYFIILDFILLFYDLGLSLMELSSNGILLM